MSRKLVMFTFIMLFSNVHCFADVGIMLTLSPQNLDKVLTDEVRVPVNRSIPVQLLGSVTAPTSMCNVITYVPCNYIIPPNDYVNFTTSINLTNCSTLNSMMLTFEAAPTVPIFVWLSNATTSTPPIYMNTASTTISKTTSSMLSWFDSTTWTNLCVQAIYSDPPPSTLYYPMSCMIVYQ